MPLATIGVFLLFLGWFGFNGGSVLSAILVLLFWSSQLPLLQPVLVQLQRLQSSKADLSMALNGVLGLVGITANADPAGAIIIRQKQCDYGWFRNCI